MPLVNGFQKFTIVEIGKLVERLFALRASAVDVHGGMWSGGEWGRLVSENAGIS
jgi:hypothetical protein